MVYEVKEKIFSFSVALGHFCHYLVCMTNEYTIKEYLKDGDKVHFDNMTREQVAAFLSKYPKAVVAIFEIKGNSLNEVSKSFFSK